MEFDGQEITVNFTDGIFEGLVHLDERLALTYFDVSTPPG